MFEYLLGSAGMISPPLGLPGLSHPFIVIFLIPSKNTVGQ